jgi:RNA polymerase-associated protein LEO1
MASDASLSENENDAVQTPAGSDEETAPRNTVEEAELGSEDEDDLFGDGGDGDEQPA